MTYKTYRICTLLSFFFISITILNSCESSDDEDLIGNWLRLSSLDGVARGDAVGFSIGNKGYLGTGYDGENRLNDFWEYDASKDAWTQKSDFPGVARNSAVGFGTDLKGYIGTGFDGKNKLNDYWEYDPSLNTWARKSDFPGSPRYAAIGMAINNKCYIGTGFDGNYVKDFWEYTPETDTWSQKTSIGGNKRRDAACFTINGIGYIVGGVDNGSYLNDIWEYNPSSDVWSKKRAISNISDDDYDNDYTSIIGIGKVGLCINGKGYLITGGQTTSSIVWEYNPGTDLWIERTSYEGSPRSDAIGFTIGSFGYVTTGKNGSYTFDDLWSFEPSATYNEDDK